MFVRNLHSELTRDLRRLRSRNASNSAVEDFVDPDRELAHPSRTKLSIPHHRFSDNVGVFVGLSAVSAQ